MANNREDLDRLAVTIKDRGATWTAGETSMSALSDAEFKTRLGVTPPPGAPSVEEMVRTLRSGAQPKDAFTAAAAVGAPASYDLRDVGGQSYVTPIKDQGGCGSCVAFGVVGVLESSLRVATKNPALDVDLSEAHLFYCHGRARGRTCGNGWFQIRRSRTVRRSVWRSRALTLTRTSTRTAPDSTRAGGSATSP